MNGKRDSVEADFARLLQPLARRWRREADLAVADLGLSEATGWVLLHIHRLGDGVRQCDLAAAIDIQGASLVRLIDQLESAGLAERRVDAQDRRANHVLLTGAGRKTVGAIEEALGEIRRAMFEGIGDRDLQSAHRVLCTLSDRAAARQESRG